MTRSRSTRVVQALWQSEPQWLRKAVAQATGMSVGRGGSGSKKGHCKRLVHQTGIFTHPTVSKHTCRHLFGRLEACFQYHELDSLLESIKETLNQASQGLCTQSL